MGLLVSAEVWEALEVGIMANDVSYFDEDDHACVECMVDPCDCGNDEAFCNMCYDCRFEENEADTFDDDDGDV